MRAGAAAPAFLSFRGRIFASVKSVRHKVPKPTLQLLAHSPLAPSLLLLTTAPAAALLQRQGLRP